VQCSIIIIVEKRKATSTMSSVSANANKSCDCHGETSSTTPTSTTSAVAAPATIKPKHQPATMEEMDHRDNWAWLYSATAAMVPFTAFCYGHGKGMTAKVVERVVKSPVGVYGLFALPFLTLGMEKSIYDTVQAWQGLDPNVVPADRGGFPSGGANLPSFSLIPVQKKDWSKSKSAASSSTE